VPLYRDTSDPWRRDCCPAPPSLPPGRARGLGCRVQGQRFRVRRLGSGVVLGGGVRV
jgi:hypothetical protein